MIKWFYTIVCVSTFSAPLARAACNVCSTGCPKTATLAHSIRSYESYSLSCQDSTATPQVSSISVTSSSENDKFTVTVLDQQGYDDFKGSKGSYSFYPDLSSGGVFDTKTESTCYHKSVTSVFPAGTKVYVVIGCNNEKSDCNLVYNVDTACLPPGPCSGVSCGTHGSCYLGLCVCDDGYSGSNCQTFDKCYSVSCGSNGACRDGVCVCNPGYTGNACQTIDKCYGVSCGSHGTCSNGECVCDSGYIGIECQTPYTCNILTCLVGTCSSKGECVCKAGFIGLRCDSIDLCYNISCGSSGTCRDGLCVCDPGYTGAFCDFVDACYGVSCGSNGTCSFGICFCDEGYTGDRCQTFDRCQNIFCVVHSRCSDGVCVCDDGFHGYACDVLTSDVVSISSTSTSNTKVIIIACSSAGVGCVIILSFLGCALFMLKRRQSVRQLQLSQAQHSLMTNEETSQTPLTNYTEFGLQQPLSKVPSQ
ncbi:tenascin-X-like [Corticium candelabrum]|uniref:tenascin-X-like n=1 Tax=Corticium candelabrum TaxID=121492 RepID=UPI002E2742EE|nr:tenascin-X-like [Corticium candelabrum]